MSSTTSWRPLIEPGSMSESPIPMTIEQAEPDGVSWTTRMPELGSVSWSTLKPIWSA
jgi:hypothetical protein